MTWCMAGGGVDSGHVHGGGRHVFFHHGVLRCQLAGWRDVSGARVHGGGICGIVRVADFFLFHEGGKDAAR